MRRWSSGTPKLLVNVIKSVCRASGSLRRCLPKIREKSFCTFSSARPGCTEIVIGVANSGAIGVAGRCAFRMARKLSHLGPAIAESPRVLSSVPEASEGGKCAEECGWIRCSRACQYVRADDSWVCRIGVLILPCLRHLGCRLAPSPALKPDLTPCSGVVMSS